MVVQCCVCQKVREGSEWVAVEEPYLATRRISHSYCPICKKASLDAIYEQRAYRKEAPHV
jgi:hypothetical protein